jgi:hypothetical protein
MDKCKGAQIPDSWWAASKFFTVTHNIFITITACFPLCTKEALERYPPNILELM